MHLKSPNFLPSSHSTAPNLSYSLNYSVHTVYNQKPSILSLQHHLDLSECKKRKTGFVLVFFFFTFWFPIAQYLVHFFCVFHVFSWCIFWVPLISPFSHTFFFSDTIHWLCYTTVFLSVQILGVAFCSIREQRKKISERRKGEKWNHVWRVEWEGITSRVICSALLVNLALNVPFFQK